MALRYGYFDSEITGVDDEGMPIFDRAETSDLFSLLFANLVSDGVLALPSNCFRVRASGNGLNLEIDPGFGMVKGHFCYNNEVGQLAITAAPRRYSRIDRVVMRCNYLQRMVEIVIKTGTEAANPVPPDLIRPAAGDYFELCLANVRLAAGQKTVTQSAITDTRPDSAVCGYITQLIDHLDTDVLFEQLDAFYKEFVARSDSSYGQFVADMDAWLDALSASGRKQLDAIIGALDDYEAGAEARFQEWFEGIKDFVASLENGEALLYIKSLFDEIFRLATDDDIDAIIAGTYVVKAEGGSLIEIAAEADIDAIIDGTYVEGAEVSSGAPAFPGAEATEQEMKEIVDDAFSKR